MAKRKQPPRYRLRRAFAWRGRYVTRRTFVQAIETMPAEDRDRFVASGAIEIVPAAESDPPAAILSSKDGNG